MRVRNNKAEADGYDEAALEAAAEGDINSAEMFRDMAAKSRAATGRNGTNTSTTGSSHPYPWRR